MSTQQHIVLYDGDCNFCNHSVQFIFKREKKTVFYFAALQSDIGKSLLSKHGMTEFDLNSVVYLCGNKVYLRSSAALQICKRLKGMWPLLFVFIVVPPFIRDYFYNQIAKRRHRLAKNNCALPSAELRKRFLD